MAERWWVEDERELRRFETEKSDTDSYLLERARMKAQLAEGYLREAMQRETIVSREVERTEFGRMSPRRLENGDILYIGYDLHYNHWEQLVRIDRWSCQESGGGLEKRSVFPDYHNRIPDSVTIDDRALESRIRKYLLSEKLSEQIEELEQAIS